MASFYKANDDYNTNLSAGYTAGQTTMSVTEVPTNVPTLVTIGYGTDKEAIYSVTNKTTNSLTGVARVSGYTGDLDAQMSVACLNIAQFVNQLSGVVSSPETLVDNIYGADGGGTDAYAISLDSPPTVYEEGMVFFFKANTANTGAASLNVSTLGAKDIKKNSTSDLNDNDIIAGQIIGVVYDGTNFQLIGGNVAKASATEINTGTEDYKFATPLQLATAGFVRDTDGALTANSDTKIATQKAVKTAIAAKVINRAFTWYLDGTSINGVAGATYIAPQNLTVTKIYGKLTSGTCVATLKNGATTIDAIFCSSTLATETTITSASITAGDLITLTISSASAPVNLIVTMEATQP